MANFNILDEQIEKLRPFLNNIDELIIGDINDFFLALDDAILKATDINFDPTPTSYMLEDIYDNIFNNN